jgi:DNA-binding response OmpR family regulator
MNILYVEDEAKIADFVFKGLNDHGFIVDYQDNGNDGYICALRNDYDVIVLDIMLPGKDGLEILKAIRQAHKTTPVILLTARNELDDRLTGLNLGADDYLAKPFFVEELVARIQALQRRTTGALHDLMQVGPLQLDRHNHELSCQDQTIELAAREFNLLEYLMRSPGKVLTRSQILEHVWCYDFVSETNVVDVYIQRLRKKLKRLHEDNWIESIRGVGYQFRQPETD